VNEKRLSHNIISISLLKYFYALDNEIPNDGRIPIKNIEINKWNKRNE
jgi:hypothetical protein